MVELDNIDKQLIQLLSRDARRTSEALAQELGTSSATVRRKIRRLIDDRTIKMIAVADPDKVGLPVTTIIALDVNKEKVETIVEELREMMEVKWISTVFGRFDLLFGARFESTDELSKFVQNTLTHVDGVSDSEVFICLNTIGGRYGQV
jgi:Lrp/AsnC family transcriptional regulator, regulator for asnA, asnC and gidA